MEEQPSLEEQPSHHAPNGQWKTMPRSDVLTIAIALLAAAVTFLLSPAWGWVCFAAGLVTLFIYFKMGRGRKPWPKYVTIGVPLCALAIVAGLLGWKLYRHPVQVTQSVAQKPDAPNAAVAPSPISTEKTEPVKETKRNKVAAKSTVEHGTTPRTKARGKEGDSNNGTVGTITQAPCSVAQIGGTGNQATGGNCGPPALVMTTSQVVVPSDKEGFIKTVITVVPNIPVSAPTGVAVEFDNPIINMGFWVAGAGSVMGGGPFRNGTHALITIGTGFNQTHPLLLTVYSVLPVNVIKPPTLE